MIYFIFSPLVNVFLLWLPYLFLYHSFCPWEIPWRVYNVKNEHLTGTVILFSFTYLDSQNLRRLLGFLFVCICLFALNHMHTNFCLATTIWSKQQRTPSPAHLCPSQPHPHLLLVCNIEGEEQSLHSRAPKLNSVFYVIQLL